MSGTGWILLPIVQKGHRFLELDSLRGLAAMAVVFQHYRNTLGDTSPPIFNVLSNIFGGGRSAVVLFFLLSGFVLTTSYMGPRRPTYLTFILKRLCRIYLPYAAAIMLAALLAARYYSTVPSGNAWIDLTWNSPYSSRLLLQHLLVMGHYDPGQFNTAIWTLILEMRVSLFFPVIAWVSCRAKPWIAVGICVVGTLLLAYLSAHAGHQNLCSTLFCSLLFLAGSVLRRHYDEAHAMLLRARWLAPCAAIVGACCYQAGVLVPFARAGATPDLEAYLQSWIVCIGAGLILLVANTSRRLRHLSHARVFLWCGARSYSIYLLHSTILFFLIRRFGIQTRPWTWVFVYLVVVFAVSEVFYRAVEVPALTLGRRLSTRSESNEVILTRQTVYT